MNSLSENSSPQQSAHAKEAMSRVLAEMRPTCATASMCACGLAAVSVDHGRFGGGGGTAGGAGTGSFQRTTGLAQARGTCRKPIGPEPRGTARAPTARAVHAGRHRRPTAGSARSRPSPTWSRPVSPDGRLSTRAGAHSPPVNRPPPALRISELRCRGACRSARFDDGMSRRSCPTSQAA